MPVNFLKPASPAPAPQVAKAPAPQAPAPYTPPPMAQPSAATVAAAQTSPSMAMAAAAPGQQAKPVASFLKTGASASSALAYEEERAERARNRTFRFFLKEGETAEITFLDGVLNSMGTFEPSWYEHTVRLGPNRMENFVCLNDVPGEAFCPLCNAGDRSALVFGFTVIDRRSYQVQKGENAGKIIPWTRKLMIAKRTTVKMLQAIAEKQCGGVLAGWTFQVSRQGGDMSPASGNVFIIGKHQTLGEIQAELGAAVVPVDYNEEIVLTPAAEMLKHGIGRPLHGPGIGAPGIGGVGMAGSPAVGGYNPAAAAKNL